MRTVPVGNFCCATAFVPAKANATTASNAVRAKAAIVIASTPCADSIGVAFSLTLNVRASGERQMHTDATIPPGAASTAPPAEVVLRNAHVITVDGRNSVAQAIAVADGKILAI